MTPAATSHQTVWTSRVGIEPNAWSFGFTDYWGTQVTTFELHEPHQRLTVHAQSVVETRGDEQPWDTGGTVPGNDLGWAALDDRGVIDSMAEFLTVEARTAPPPELAELVGDLSADRGAAELRDRLDECHQQRGRGLGAVPRGVPGLCARDPRSAAFDRSARPIRLGLSASRRVAAEHHHHR